MSCCGGGGAIDPRTNKPVVTVNNTVDGSAPSSAAAAAQAFGTQDATQRLPPFFFTKMPDEEPSDSKDLIPVGTAEEAALRGSGAAGQKGVDVGNRDQDLGLRQQSAVSGPQIATPEKSAPERAYGAQGMVTAGQPSPSGSLPALLQVIEVKGADGQMTYHVVEATPPPPMQVS